MKGVKLEDVVLHGGQGQNQFAGDDLLNDCLAGKIDYIISTSSKGRIPTQASVQIRRKAVERSIPCLTSIDTAHAIADSLHSKYNVWNTELVDINNMRKFKEKRHFVKMHGCGNDYIYFDCLNSQIDNPEGLSLSLSDRRLGIGGDGCILICPSRVADAKMRIFNLDGSEGKMCGNGIRCVGKYLYDWGIVKKRHLTIETLSGIRKLTLHLYDGKAERVTVDMGKAELRPRMIPVLLDGDKAIDRKVTIDGVEYGITCVSMGNPHCVVFVNTSPDTIPLDKIGPKFEHNELFPERVNTEFIEVVDSQTLNMRVWERGSGETWACGTGACAAAVAAVENGFCTRGTDITVRLKGGDLIIRYEENGTVRMTGDAQVAFEGDVIL